MKLLIVITAFIVGFTSCETSRGDDKKLETPTALENANFSSKLVYKRGSSNLIESLYLEEMGKTPELTNLEDEINTLRESKGDTINHFENFNVKNQSYYNTANDYVGQIADTFLRDRVKNLVASSLEKYNISINQHRSLLKEIEKKDITLSDLHTVIKITRTLPKIEEFQKENVPSVKPLENLSKQFDGVIIRADTLSKK